MNAEPTRPDIPAAPVPARYHRKQETVEALHWDGYPVTATVIIDWILGHGGTARYHDGPSALSIDAPGGTVNAVPGDWIARREDGTFWPWEDWDFTGTWEADTIDAGAPAVTSPAPAPVPSATAAGPSEGGWRERAEAAEAELAAQREYDTYRRALWVMVRQFGGSVFLTSGQMEDVPLLASLGVGREPGGIRINAGEEP